jgi:putative SOS response-associated peptidase YedK
MCGRYGRRADKQRIADAMQAGYVNVFEDFPPSYNIAPTDIQPIVRLSRDTGERELTMMRWGLVPFWAKGAKLGISTINARAESLMTSPIYREAFQHRRCLVPAEWFYEWQSPDAKTKQPFAISLNDHSIFAFAGLWESWKNQKTGERLITYTIVTTDPNDLMERLHNRMPVILAPKDYARWLSPAPSSQLPIDLLRPFPADEMTAWRVSRAVGNVKNNDPSLIVSV